MVNEDAKLKNEALRISMEWGPRRTMPFATRMREVSPTLLDRQIHDLEVLSKEVERAAFGSVVSTMKQHGRDEMAARQAWKDALVKTWPWLNDANLASAWTQGCYYAWHDGELT